MSVERAGRVVARVESAFCCIRRTLLYVLCFITTLFSMSYDWWRRRESNLSSPFRFCNLLTLQTEESAKRHPQAYPIVQFCWLKSRQTSLPRKLTGTARSFTNGLATRSENPGSLQDRILQTLSVELPTPVFFNQTPSSVLAIQPKQFSLPSDCKSLARSRHCYASLDLALIGQHRAGFEARAADDRFYSSVQRAMLCSA